jgi:hypothetical protein
MRFSSMLGEALPGVFGEFAFGIDGTLKAL